MYSIACIENKNIIGNVNSSDKFIEFIKQTENIEIVIICENVDAIIEKLNPGLYLFYDNATKIFLGEIKKIINNSYFKYFYGENTRNEIIIIRTYELFKEQEKEQEKEQDIIYNNESDQSNESNITLKYCELCKQYDNFIESYNELNNDYTEFIEKTRNEKIYNFNLFEKSDYKEYAFSYITGEDNINKTETAVYLVDIIMNKYNIDKIYLYETNNNLYNIWNDVYRTEEIYSLNNNFKNNIKRMIETETKNKIVVIHLNDDILVKSEALLALMAVHYENNINLIIITDIPYRFNKLIGVCIDYIIVHNDINPKYIENLYYSYVPQYKISLDEFKLNLSINDKLIIDKDKGIIFNGF